MIKTKEHFTKASDESIETTHELLKTSLESIERLTKLNLNASRKFLEETTHALKEMTTVTNPKDLFEKVNQLAKHTVENNMSSCRDVYDVITETQTKIGKMLESHIHATQKNVATAAGNFSKLNTKPNFASDAVNNWMNSTNQAMETLNKMASQISNFTHSNLNNMKSAAEATASAVKQATKK
jgi:phasin family protein